MIVAKRLRTEYLYEPVGIDITRPRFFWNCGWDEEEEKQECCRQGTGRRNTVRRDTDRWNTVRPDTVR